MRNPALWVGAALILAASAQAQDVDHVISRYVAARGGSERLKGVRAERLTGRISLPGGLNGVDTIELARPLRVRTTIHFSSGVLIQGYDGHTVWGVNPFQGDTAPHPLDAGTAKNVIAGGDMDGPLVDYATKGNRLTLLGIDTADGRPAYAIRVVRPDSTDDTYFVDTASFLQVKWQGHRVMDGKPVVFESYFRDYRRVGGVMIAFRIDSGVEGEPAGQHMIFDAALVDPPISDARFVMPPAGSR
jgi:hypothetical protein